MSGFGFQISLTKKRIAKRNIHEYKTEDIITLFRETLKMSDILAEEAASEKKYAADKFGVIPAAVK